MIALAIIALGSIPARAGQTSMIWPANTACRVDPRSRGADPPNRGGAFAGVGRSPLARGRPDRRGDAKLGAGSIPARAGQTIPDSGSDLRLRVDPRSRGADACGALTRYPDGGRSPLARGRHNKFRYTQPRQRSIPARAGQTPRRLQSRARSGVDPRSRGADGDSGSVRITREGRSPLARGRHQRGRRPLPAGGSIPARAGQTPRLVDPASPREVDPRSRGADRQPSAQ